MKAWHDVDDVADLIGIQRRTVLKWCRERKLPHMRLGRSIRFTPEQIQEIQAAYSVRAVEAIDVDIPNPAFRQREAVVVPMVKPTVA